jgi:hypothetical protein
VVSSGFTTTRSQSKSAGVSQCVGSTETVLYSDNWRQDF